jgi:hypothetical protein
MTYSGLFMWDGSSKIHYFIDFWHPSSWRLWRARNIKKIITDELGINGPISKHVGSKISAKIQI